jgi:hypothetical protein
MRKLPLAVALATLLPAAVASGYTLKHPHREHCRQGFNRVRTRHHVLCVARPHSVPSVAAPSPATDPRAPQPAPASAPPLTHPVAPQQECETFAEGVHDLEEEGWSPEEAARIVGPGDSC